MFDTAAAATNAPWNPFPPEKEETTHLQRWQSPTKHASLSPMKSLLPLAFGLFLASCDSSRDDSSKDSEAPAKITAEEHANLIKQKLELERDLGRLIAAQGSDEGAAIEATKDRLNEAYMNLRKTQNDHPLLKPLMEKQRTMQLSLRQARENGDMEQVQLIQAEIIKISDELKKTGSEQPEIVEAQAQITRIKDELNQARRELALNLPDAKHLVEGLDTIEKQLMEATQ